MSGISSAGNVPVFEIADRPFKHWTAAFKWTEDKLLSVLLLFWLGPLLGLIAVLIKLETRGPVFFRQERYGFNHNVIQVLKFRTMYVDSGDPTGAARTVRNDPRVTRLGRWLRRLSLDELPQLINVLRGDMSMIGPRPHAIAMRAGDRLYGGRSRSIAGVTASSLALPAGPSQWLTRRSRYGDQGSGAS